MTLIHSYKRVLHLDLCIDLVYKIRAGIKNTKIQFVNIFFLGTTW